MLAFSNDYYGLIFRAKQSVELFCAYDECNLLNYNLPGRDQIVRVVSLSLKDYLLKVENRILVKRKSNKNKEARTLYEQEIKTQHVRFREFYNEISHDDHKVLEERDYFDQE